LTLGSQVLLDDLVMTFSEAARDGKKVVCREARLIRLVTQSQFSTMIEQLRRND
jgi:hypothetical protein